MERKQLAEDGKTFKLGQKAFFSHGWSPPSRRYEGVVGTIIKLEGGLVRLRYPNETTMGPAPRNVTVVVENNRQMVQLLDKEW